MYTDLLKTFSEQNEKFLSPVLKFNQLVAQNIEQLANIQVNAVSPGFVNTELTQKILGTKEIKSLIERIPLGRLAKPEEIAKVVLFLCSKHNSYITGQNIVIDGGFTSA